MYRTTNLVDESTGEVEVGVYGPPGLGFLSLGLGEGSISDEIEAALILFHPGSFKPIEFYEVHGTALVEERFPTHDVVISSQENTPEYMGFTFRATKLLKQKLVDTSYIVVNNGYVKIWGYTLVSSEIVEYSIKKPTPPRAPVYTITTELVDSVSETYEVEVTGPPDHDYFAVAFRSDKSNHSPYLTNSSSIAVCPTCSQKVLFFNYRSNAFSIVANPHHDLEMLSTDCDTSSMKIKFRASFVLDTHLASIDSVLFASGPKDENGLLAYHERREKRVMTIT